MPEADLISPISDNNNKTTNKTSMPSKEAKMAHTIGKNHQYAKSRQSKWHTVAIEDILMALGDQWKAKEKEDRASRGQPSLTLNIIQPLIYLVAGHQRDSKSSIRAYPEGGEDELKSEIATRLLKHLEKKTQLQMKISEQFEEGVMIGKGFSEAYTDYSDDLINGKMKFKNLDPLTIYIDPKSSEYDLSDAEYVIKESLLTKDKLKELFPEKNNLIDTLTPEKLDNTAESGIPEILAKGEDYDKVNEMVNSPDVDLIEDEYIVLEYWYKSYKTKWLAIDADLNLAELLDSQTKAEEFLIYQKQRQIEQIQSQAEQQKLTADEFSRIEIDRQAEHLITQIQIQNRQKVIKRIVMEIRVAHKVSSIVLEDKLSPFYPEWKSYPIFPYFSHYTPLAKRALKRDDLAYQGIVRNLKDPQKEKNKRRSAILHHLGSSSNSGWLTEENSWVNSKLVRQFGSTAGVNLEYKKEKPKPERISPVQISQGHLILEQSGERDINLISGINADMLSQQSNTESGKAIALRQQQGTRMIKRIFDNFLQTKEIIGYFLLSQLNGLFPNEKIMQILGDKLIQEHQLTPDGLDQIMQGMNNEGYDIAVGEMIDSPTIKYMNMTLLMDLAKEGLAVPPDVLLEYTDLPINMKNKILQYNQQMQQMQAQQAQQNIPAGNLPR